MLKPAVEAKVIHNAFLSFAYAPPGFNLLRGLFFLSAALCPAFGPSCLSICSSQLTRGRSAPHSGQRQLFGILELTWTLSGPWFDLNT